MNNNQNNRFIYSKSNSSKYTYITDTVNNYRISYSEDEGYLAYSMDDSVNLVYKITPDGTTTFYLEDGSRIMTKDKFGIEDINKTVDIIDENGNNYTIDNGVITKKTDYVGNNKTETYYDKNRNITKKIEFRGDSKTYYDKDGKVFRKEKPDEISVYTKDGEILIENGRYYRISRRSNGIIVYTEDGEMFFENGRNYSDKIEPEGTCIIDENGNIICQKKDGSVTTFNEYGEKIKFTSKDGSSYEYNEKTETLITSSNGKKTYSRMNHIEYDEGEYNNILNTLNNIDGKKVENEVTAIGETIRGFPDPFSGNISNISDLICKNNDLIKSLGEMTNYSLLAYQVCDDSLRDGLETLVNSIFGEGNSSLANSFINGIKSTIEDRDNDNILEYKENTNFKVLSQDLIVASTYLDDDGNTWYLNKNKTVIGIDGNNIKFSYGDNTFNLFVNEDGIVTIKDSNGNNIDIFGDYNLDSSQFGGNQESFKNLAKNVLYYYDVDTLDSILSEYFPEASLEQKVAFYNKLSETGCGYIAMTNLVFKKFEGNESGFYNTFGYPMYNIKMEKDGFVVDYNYEPLTLDLYCHINSMFIGKKLGIEDATKYARGTFEDTVHKMEDYLDEEYNVSLKDLPNEYEYLAVKGYNLYYSSGSLFYPNGEAHAMIGVGKTDDGRTIVSSWGKKYIIELSDDPSDMVVCMMYH